jgi:hypothetical protein
MSSRHAGAIKSLGQFTAEGNRAPFDMRSFQMQGVFGGFYGQIYFEMENLALFNNAAYSVAQQRMDVATKIDDEIESILAKGEPEDEDDRAFVERMIVRRRMAADDQSSIAASTMRYADEHTIIACWAFVEKHVNRTINELNAALGGSAQRDYRWDGMKAALLSYGIDLTSLGSYADANECRIVNNTIKHSGIISPTLAQTPAFANKAGQSLDGEVLDTQRYYFGVYDFVGELFELASGALPAANGTPPP